jgi:hypothetical protein
MMLRGLGDWFEPDCTPGTPNCVPHWYCYIPGAATPDCLLSLQQGFNTIGSAAGQTVGGVVNSTVTGVVQGAAGDTTGTTTNFISTTITPLILLGAGAIGLYFLFKK